MARLDGELEQQPKNTHDTRGVSAEDNVMRERRRVWLKTHREEYTGQYVALVMVAVMHFSRAPGYWKSRITKR